jgi:periplasmic protein TonB
MKQLITLLCLAFASTTASAQDSTKVFVDKEAFTSVQIEASFPGGVNAWKQYLERNLKVKLGEKYIKIPPGQKSARQTVIVSFVVDPKGNVSDVKAENENDVHPKLAEEAVRVIKKGPRWMPAQLNGENVQYRQRQTITWVVTTE